MGPMRVRVERKRLTRAGYPHYHPVWKLFPSDDAASVTVDVVRTSDTPNHVVLHLTNGAMVLKSQVVVLGVDS